MSQNKINVLVRILVFTCVLTSVIYFLTFVKQSQDKNINHASLHVTRELTDAEYKKASQKYLSLLEKENPQKALDALRTDITTNDSLVRSCHALAHELGHASYEKYKDFGEALKYQSEICNSGYLHGIIETHFSTVGDIKTAMKSVCNSYPDGSFIEWECYHGVGHGLMYYNSNDLPESLKQCNTYPSREDASSCSNGVFMENFNTEQKLHPSKYLDKDNLFFPCNVQKKEDKANCYIYAPANYLTIHKNQYTKALDWCNTAEDGYRAICTQGVGVEMMKENINNPLFVEKTCATGTSSQEKSCIGGAIGLYINHYGSTIEASNLCKTLKPSHQKQCKEIVDSKSALFLK